jgi:hypothetical protein
MSYADIETAWRSPHNRPTPAELEEQKQNLRADLRRRRRGFVVFIAATLAALTLITGRIALHLLWPDPALDRINPAREWGFLLTLALPWAGAVTLLRHYLRHRAAHGDHARSIADSVRALLDENRLSRVRLKVAAILHGLFLLVLPVVVWQLRAAGKAGDEILLPAFVVWPCIALGIGCAMWFHDRRTLRPRQRALETLLADYAATPSEVSGAH